MSSLVDILGLGDPKAPAIILGSDGPTYTRSQIHQACISFAQILRKGGVNPGDVVTIAEANTIDYIIAFLGTTYARAVAAPLNQNYTKDEFEFYMEDAGSKLLITGPSGNAAAEAAAAVPVLSVELAPPPSAEGLPTLDVRVRKGEFNVTSITPDQAASLEDPPLTSDEALFLHTSGTTSRPKGVPLSHSNLAASIQNIVDTYEFVPNDVSLLVMPLFHVHGLMAGLLAPLHAGASVVLPAGGKFSAATFWKDAVDNKVTFYTAVPTIHQILVARAEQDYPKDNPPPLRVIRSCSSSLAPATLHKVEELFKAPVLEAYAMTEASHQMTSNPLPKRGAHKPGTVGQAQGSVQVTVLGPGPEFKQLQPGEIGEVCIKGPNVTAGYRNNPVANADSFTTEGWFRTGDQGVLDVEGYLQLTGRIKELINRGGEKISPLEVDATLLSHADVAEAVSFAAPDDKYGEVVAAAVVLTEQGKSKLQSGEDLEASIKAHCGAKLAAFKVPVRVFIADELPKTATGKVQRRMMVDAFMSDKTGGTTSAGGDQGHTKSSNGNTSTVAPEFPADGFFLVAQTLAKLGVQHMFGVVGIPVTQLASAAQACGIRYIGCRNEQAAGYAAAAAGFLTGVPGVLLTVSGPGVVHGLAGLSDAQVNCWPMIMISGSCETNEVGKGAFQELDQVAAVHQYVKLAKKPTKLQELPAALTEAFTTALAGRPGATYVDLPSDILMSSLGENASAEVESLLNQVPASPSSPKISAPESNVAAAAALLKEAQRPLLVFGKGAAYGKAEESLKKLVDGWSIPFLGTSMGRGVVGDDSFYCANAARSMALSQADVVVIFGGRLNWQLHFGEPPKWSESVKFILVDPEPTSRDAQVAAAVLRGDAATVALQLLKALPPNSLSSAVSEWAAVLSAKAVSSTAKLEEKLAPTANPLNYYTTLRIIRDEILKLNPQPIVVSEGANTMDNARLILSPVVTPRSRLDAGTWGTMGVGPGYALAAAVTCPGRNVIAVEGDSAFGFSAMEIETACRYNLPITFIIFNNGGVYGGDRRESALANLAQSGLEKVGYGVDLAPTAFVPGSRYDMLATAFGGVGVRTASAAELESALKKALMSKKTTIIDVEIDPMAGVESGTVHAFNAPKSSGPAQVGGSG